MLAKFQLSQAAIRAKLPTTSNANCWKGSRTFPGSSRRYAQSARRSLPDTLFPISSLKTTDFKPSNRAFGAFGYDVSPDTLPPPKRHYSRDAHVSFQTDNPKTPAVAVVNQEFARRLFHSEDVVGRYFKNSPASRSRSWEWWPTENIFCSRKPEGGGVLPDHAASRRTHTSLIVAWGLILPKRPRTILAATLRKVVHGNLDPAVPCANPAPGRPARTDVFRLPGAEATSPSASSVRLDCCSRSLGPLAWPPTPSASGCAN